MVFSLMWGGFFLCIFFSISNVRKLDETTLAAQSLFFTLVSIQVVKYQQQFTNKDGQLILFYDLKIIQSNILGSDSLLFIVLMLMFING